jgi:hypothetical protein
MFRFALATAAWLAAGAALANQTATASWINATQWDDGSALVEGDLAETHVHYELCSIGPTRSSPSVTVATTTPGATHEVDIALGPGDWCLVAYHMGSNGELSGPSNVAQKTIPNPAPAPPVGLTVSDTVVYTMRIQPDSIILQPVGTVPDGTACDTSQSINGLYRVNRDVVMWAGSAEPWIVVAKCG